MITNLIEKTTNLFTNKKLGSAEIILFNITEQDVEKIRRPTFFGYNYYEYYDLIPGKYVKLRVNDELVMTNTPMEIRTNQEIIKEAKGNVLIGGLGLGIILTAIAEKKEVTKIVVVEKESDVINLVVPFLTKKTKSKVKIINEDVFNFTTEEKFDVLYFDIWNTISYKNYDDMKLLTEKYRKNRNKNSKLLHWRKEDCKRQYFR